MPTEEHRWSFYVDESGPFDGNDSDSSAQGAGHSVVAGVLVPRALDVESASIETRLREANPIAPWPHHAWYTHQSAMFALWSLAGRGKANRIQRSHDAKAAWRTRCRKLFDSCVKLIEAGREPGRADVSRLARELGGASEALHGELAAARHSAITGTTRVIESIAAAGDEAAVRLYAALDADDSCTQTSEIVDPYLRTLAVLTERVAHALLLTGGRHHVKLCVLGRKVSAPFGTATIKMAMKRIHVEAAAKSASTETLSVERGGAQVRFTAEPVCAYGPSLHPLHVVADFVAFGARPILSRHWALRRVIADLALTVGLRATLEGTLVPLAEAPGDVPLVSSDGAARTYVDQAFRGIAPERERLASCLRPWVREQALAMGAALGA